MSQEKVLIVEDEENERTGLAELVSAWGYRAETARDGAEGLEKVTNWSPSIVVTDLKMPRINGFEVLEWIRQQPSLNALRVVVLTASDEMRDVNRAYQLGANSFLVKPVDFAHFVEVTQALKGYWIWMSKEPQIARSPRLIKTEK